MEQTNLKIDFFAISRIPSPTSIYGRPASPMGSDFVRVPYDGTSLPSFVLKNGGDPAQWRDILRLNRVGTVFELERGVLLSIPQKASTFSVHEEA